MRVVDPLTDGRWDAFVESQPGATVYHLAAWAGILATAYRHRPTALALEDGNGRLHGILPLVYKAGPVTGRRLASLPIVNLGGPLAGTPALEAALVAAACRVAEEMGATLRVFSRSASFGDLLPSADVAPMSPAWVAPVPDNVSDVPGAGKQRANLARYIRKAQAAGLTGREATSAEDLRAFHRVYLRTAMKHRAVPHSLRLFEQVRRALAPRGAFQLVLIERDGEPVAGGLNLVWRDLVEALFFGVDERCLDARPSHLLHWETLRIAHARGLARVNFGSAERGGSQAAFKAQWGAEPLSAYRLVHPSAPASAEQAQPATTLWDRRFAETVWTRTPIPVMHLAGDRMHRYL